MTRKPETVKYIRNVGSGAPTMRGIIVRVLYGRFIAGESIDYIAFDYDILPEEVIRAIRHHGRVLAKLEPERTA